MRKCLMCGYVYDEDRETELFDELPPSWTCPDCNAPKAAFIRR